MLHRLTLILVGKLLATFESPKVVLKSQLRLCHSNSNTNLSLRKIALGLWHPLKQYHCAPSASVSLHIFYINSALSPSALMVSWAQRAFFESDGRLLSADCTVGLASYHKLCDDLLSRSGMANYAFRFRFDPWGLASCVSCTSVLLSAACTTPYTASFETLTALSIGYLLVVGFSLCMSYEPNMSYKSC